MRVPTRNGAVARRPTAARGEKKTWTLWTKSRKSNEVRSVPHLRVSVSSHDDHTTRDQARSSTRVLESVHSQFHIMSLGRLGAPSVESRRRDEICRASLRSLANGQPERTRALDGRLAPRSLADAESQAVPWTCTPLHPVRHSLTSDASSLVVVPSSARQSPSSARECTRHASGTDAPRRGPKRSGAALPSIRSGDAEGREG